MHNETGSSSEGHFTNITGIDKYVGEVARLDVISSVASTSVRERVTDGTVILPSLKSHKLAQILGSRDLPS